MSLEQSEKKELAVGSNGGIIGSTLEERYRVCSLYAKSGMLPKAYDTAEKVFAGLQYSIELGFIDKPLTALRNIAIINGQPSLWGELPLALCYRSGKLEFIDEFYEDKEGKRLPETCSSAQIFAAVCMVQRKGSNEKKFAYTQNDKTSLGVAAIWKQFEKVMMMRKARALALKAVFPDVLLGIDIGEYSYHKHESEVNSGDVIEVDHNDIKLADVNAKFNGDSNE